MIAVLGIIAISVHVPISGAAILFFPYWEFWYLFYKTEPVSDEIKSKIRAEFPCSGMYFIRDCGHRYSHAISLPLLKMICISEWDLVRAYGDNSLSDDERIRSKCIIAHEIGHLGQYDRMVFRWAQIILALLFFHLTASLYRGVLINKHFFMGDLLFTAGAFIVAVLFCVMVFRVAKRREHIADLSAYLIMGNTYITGFIDKEIAAEKRRKNRWYIDLANSLSHPGFSERKKALSEIMPSNLFQARFISFQWFVCIWASFAAIQAAVVIYWHALLLIFLAFFYFPYIALASISRNAKLQLKLIDEYFVGFVAANILLLFLMFNRELFGHSSGSNSTPSDFFVVFWGFVFQLCAFAFFYFLSLIILSLRCGFSDVLMNLKKRRKPATYLKFWRGFLIFGAVNFVFAVLTPLALFYWSGHYFMWRILVVAVGFLICAWLLINSKWLRLLVTQNLRAEWSRGHNVVFFIVSAIVFVCLCIFFIAKVSVFFGYSDINKKYLYYYFVLSIFFVEEIFLWIAVYLIAKE